MPQLDKVSFFSQYFWLCVFFFGLYIFGLKFFLPEMSRILKFRKKRLSASSTLALQGENDKVRNSAETALEKLFKNLRAVFKVSSLENEKWFSDHLIKFSGKFKKGSLRYLHSIAKKSVSNNLSITAVSTDFSNKVFLSMLTGQLLSTGSSQKRSYTTRLSTLASTESIEGESPKQKKKGRKKKVSSSSPFFARGDEASRKEVSSEMPSSTPLLKKSSSLDALRATEPAKGRKTKKLNGDLSTIIEESKDSIPKKKAKETKKKKS